jgi:hypothetical protein
MLLSASSTALQQDDVADDKWLFLIPYWYRWDNFRKAVQFSTRRVGELQIPTVRAGYRLAKGPANTLAPAWRADGGR